MTMPNLLRSAPYFPVPKLDKAITYYETVLGFRATAQAMIFSCCAA